MKMRIMGLLMTSSMAVAVPAYAQQQTLAEDQSTPSDEIVVTAVARGQNRLNSSVTVSSLSNDDIAKAAPRSVAEIFRNLPGIRSESSGGEGNANISVRGLPVALAPGCAAAICPGIRLSRPGSGEGYNQRTSQPRCR